jgi:Protein of unknown function (DUF2948)
MSEPELTDLRLLALDAEDLSVISAHLQDAVGLVGDMAYLPREQRFAAILNRFDWANALTQSQSKSAPHVRRRSAVRFERVRSARVQGLDLTAKRQHLSLLAIRFDPTDPPAGHVTLLLAGGAAIRLEVECIEVELRDLGAAWAAKSRPDHPESD